MYKLNIERQTLDGVEEYRIEALSLSDLALALGCSEFKAQDKVERYVARKLERDPDQQNRMRNSISEIARVSASELFFKSLNMAQEMVTFGTLQKEKAIQKGLSGFYTGPANIGMKNAMESLNTVMNMAVKLSGMEPSKSGTQVTINNSQNQQQVENQFLTPTQAVKMLETEGSSTAMDPNTHLNLFLKNGIGDTEECKALVSDGQGFNRGKALEAIEAKILSGQKHIGHEDRREQELGIQEGDVE